MTTGKIYRQIAVIGAIAMILSACATAYKATPLPFKPPSAYPNATEIARVTIGARAYADSKAAKEAFGFDVRGAGMLPVQAVFDHKGTNTIKINAAQTFLEDNEGNLWPVLSDKIAFERATKYSKTKEVFKQGAYGGLLGATAGAIVGGAIGVITGDNVAVAAGKGAAVGGAAGSTIGGVKGYTSKDARRDIVSDLKEKSLENKVIHPGNMGFGVIFFPGEAKTARQLRLQLVEPDTGAVHVVMLTL